MRILIWITAFLVILSSRWQIVQAESNDFYILPKNEKSPTEKVRNISNSWWNVWDQYDKEAYEMWWAKKNQHNLWMQMSSWIMNWNTIIDYFVYGLRFLSQIGLLIWSLMFVYSWYDYASSAIVWGEPSKDIVKEAMIWILIVIFSYAIMRILTTAFLT